MIEERKTEEFETDMGKWKVYFDMGDKFDDRYSCVDVRFAKAGDHLTPQDIEELKQDLKDLGKLRIIKQGKGFLEKQRR